MKRLIIFLPLVLLPANPLAASTPPHAQVVNPSDAETASQFEFRGKFIGTYIADNGFLSKIPAGTKLICPSHCSPSKSVRIYVFEKNGKRELFWTTDRESVIFDDDNQVKWYGTEGHILYYDQTHQVIYRTHQTIEDDIQMSRKLQHPTAPTYRQLVEMGNQNEAIHDEELKERLKKYNRR